MINTFWNYVGGSNLPSVAGTPVAPARSDTRRFTQSPKSIRPEYSLAGLQYLVDELIEVTGFTTDMAAGNVKLFSVNTTADHLVELVRSISEVLLWGEQNESDSQMFDYFCERGVMRIFVTVLNSESIEAVQIRTGLFSSPSIATTLGGTRMVKIQLLQTISILVLNIKRDTSLYFLFSNNSINQLISNNTNLDFSDEEILSYYVSFMKSVALRLSGETVKLFINDKTNYFPLFVQSIRFFDHHERMIRTSVRATTLALFRLMRINSYVRKFLHENSGGYFSLIASQLKDLWGLIDRAIKDGEQEGSALLRNTLIGTVNMTVDELTDQLEYVSDISRLGFPEITLALEEKLRVYAIDQVLVRSLVGASDGTVTESAPPLLSYKTSLLALSMMMDVLPIGVSGDLIGKFVNPSQLTKQLNSLDSPESELILGIFAVLLERQNVGEEDVIRLGLIPTTKSMDVYLLLLQLIGKQRLSMTCFHMVLYLLSQIMIVDAKNIFLIFSSDTSSTSLSPFVRPIIVTLQESIKAVSSRAVQTLNDSLLTKLSVSPRTAVGSPSKFGSLRKRTTSPPPVTTQIDYGIVDVFEKVMKECISTAPILLSVRSLSDMLKVSHAGNILIGDLTRSPPSVEDDFRKFIILSSLCGIHVETMSEQLSGVCGITDEPSDSQPPTPTTGEFADASSEAEDQPSTEGPKVDDKAVKSRSKQNPSTPIPADITEGSSIDLSGRDRILCSHVTIGKSTRYLIVDPSRLILVSPELTMPGFATVKFVCHLRNVSSIFIDRENEKMLRVQLANADHDELLSFEDLRRTHLALMHLEHRRIEIRKRIFQNIKKFMSYR